jgi:hypothetical protein
VLVGLGSRYKRGLRIHTFRGEVHFGLGREETPIFIITNELRAKSAIEDETTHTYHRITSFSHQMLAKHQQNTLILERLAHWA